MPTVLCTHAICTKYNFVDFLTNEVLLSGDMLGCRKEFRFVCKSERRIVINVEINTQLRVIEKPYNLNILCMSERKSKASCPRLALARSPAICLPYACDRASETFGLRGSSWPSCIFSVNSNVHPIVSSSSVL